MLTVLQEPKKDTNIAAIWRLLMRIAIIAAVIFSFYRLRSVITTLFIAAVIAYTLDWLVVLMTRWQGFVKFHQLISNGIHVLQQLLLGRSKLANTPPKMRRHSVRLIATLYSLVIAVFFIWEGAIFVVKPFVSEFKSATTADPLTHRSQLQTAWERGLSRYDSNPIIPDALKSDKLLSQLRSADALDRVKQAAGSVVPEGLRRVAEGLKSVVEIVLLPVLAFYFLVDGRKLKHEFVSLVPRHNLVETLRMTNEFNRIMRAFISSQFLLCLIAGVVVGTGLALLHVDFPITLGVLAGITRAIPIIGPIVGGIPIVLLTLADKGPAVALAVLGFFTFLHFAESKFIMPILIGDRMELHPVIVIVVLLVGGEAGSLLIGGALGSLLGMFFAAPVAALVKVMVKKYWLKVPHLGNGKKINLTHINRESR